MPHANEQCRIDGSYVRWKAVRMIRLHTSCTVHEWARRIFQTLAKGAIVSRADERGFAHVLFICWQALCMEIVSAIGKRAQKKRIVWGVLMTLATTVLRFDIVLGTYNMLFAVRADPLAWIQNWLVNTILDERYKQYQSG